MFTMYHELFQKFQSAKSKEDQIRILRNFSMERGGSRLPEFLNAAFNPMVKFDISKIPTYKPSDLPAGLNDTYLHQELSKLYLFIEGHPRRVTKLPEKKEQSILTQILCYLHQDEAKILTSLLTKSLSTHVKGLTATLAKEAFPNLPYTVNEPESSVSGKKDKKSRGTNKKV